jgi:hypothetical protein
VFVVVLVTINNNYNIKYIDDVGPIMILRRLRLATNRFRLIIYLLGLWGQDWDVGVLAGLLQGLSPNAWNKKKIPHFKNVKSINVGINHCFMPFRKEEPWLDLKFQWFHFDLTAWVFFRKIQLVTVEIVSLFVIRYVIENT